ncbi:MAG: GatB/YqeY domain-containing protein [Eubacteriaceae bacterium]|nr:GatB/YqeY domain-containing protein [Eubacteriaceae bacterium]
MQELKVKLLADLKSAMKDKDTIRKNAVTLVRAGILQIEKDKKIELDDEGIIEVISKQLKERRDSLPDFEKAGREDLINATNEEIKILLSYLPEQLSLGELDEMIRESIERLSIESMKQMGALMADLAPRIKGKADSKLVGEISRNLLK